MKSLFLITALSILTPCLATAQKLGDHPAIVVQRLQAHAGYDYEFYPHPAWCSGAPIGKVARA